MRARWVVALSLVTAAATAAALEARESSRPAGQALLVRRARVFDGRSERLSPPTDVLVVEDRIGLISAAPLQAPDGAVVIDAGGRVLMPGLIDAHVRLLSEGEDPGYAALRAAAALSDMLRRGFTSARDLGGGADGLRRAVDEGLIEGPRLLVAGGPVGRGRAPSPLALPPGLSGDAVLVAAREALRGGAALLGVRAGGGLGRDAPPLDVVELTRDELTALVRTASDWGTYASVAAYSAEGARRAVEAGARCVDHGHLLDAPTLRLLAERGVFLSAARPAPCDGPRAEQALEHLDRVMTLARELGVRVAFGTDLPLDLLSRQSEELEARTAWFSPLQVLRQATSINGDLLALAGRRSPYRGPLGVVEEGALADLLLVDGDPLQDLTGLARDPARTIRVVVKGGRVLKDDLPPRR